MKRVVFFTFLAVMILASSVSACQKSEECYPGCTFHKECPENKLCINERCRDPCAGGGGCGINALCTLVNRSPQCKCPEGTTGSPYSECTPVKA